MTDRIRSYKDLDVWKKGMEIAKVVYSTTENYPKNEQFGLVTQMRRSAVSIPSNIAEGFRRQYDKEFKQFLYVGLGSCAELETQISLSKEFGYISSKVEEAFAEMLDHCGRMITNLIKRM